MTERSRKIRNQATKGAGKRRYDKEVKPFPSLPSRGRQHPKAPQTCPGHAPCPARPLPGPGTREPTGVRRGPFLGF